MAFTRKKINTTTASEWLATTGCNIALAKAPNGTLWAVYADTDANPNKDLYVAYSSDGGTTWTEELALTDGRVALGNSDGGKRIALMVDSNSVPHIIFLGLNAADTWVGRIRYFNRVGGSWGAVETIVSADAGTNFSGLSACIDSTNTFHLLATGDVTTVALYYWTGTTGSWSAAQSVDAAGTGGDITVTSANLAICIYNDAGGIKYNTRSGGTWANEETVSTDTGSYEGNKLVVDSADNIHVVWNETISSLVGIKYRKRTSGVWGTEQTVISAGADDYGYPLLGIDSSNNVYVIYQYDRGTTQAETVWYKQIVSEVVGTETVLDSLATQPNTKPCPYAYLWHRFPSSGILSSGNSPCCLLLDETGTDADVYFLGREAGNELSGVLWVESETLRFLSKSGVERTLGETQFARAYATIDLSGAAVSNISILHTSRALTLLKAIILYTEASSADAGVTIEIGKEADADYYYTGASEVSKALWYELDTTLLQTDLAAGDTLICGCAGGKVGTGEVLICVEYKIA